MNGRKLGRKPDWIGIFRRLKNRFSWSFTRSALASRAVNSSCSLVIRRLRTSGEFGLQHLTRVEQNYGMQTAAMRAIAHRVAKNTDAVPDSKRMLSPTETLQDGRAAGDDIPFNGFTAAIGLKHKRECRMRIAPLERLHRPFKRECLIQVVCGVRMMCEGGQRHER
jgi:hypothetical protein